ncbi:TetR/AcrR family transcriptional regulator [Ethanoligenens harbinense]|uniref:Regulatory protein TetR n=1 Tax=Ethanoligenens harbinense (strain DSM 18485 / JCM 12961 / CGMCC 1.5033 / YUAN-3) TaxID=663278 RepID=E6U958_ETHHY|nr:TetR/AcrR family transcriptional regulator [Ethanoligenens harbinense]ADU27217.1 regulatory protein TetR [Ethanoligenens harbinense YUAN-3]AVQ96286.1 TetR/AcrR family transcriptional regulator [Ethanoligenens harbinense YUAN-3]AYF38945.1 TetR/AcrR family transcriptional regulator [Ethanoligenens harbinense]AYF41697.1 TetR/AcrR family transcriptional regulator [Ethanoligenens harbinense]QCN92527.1 TetR/AcrR family transcriptional regulator [Ethanoligenens harbinense]
MSTKQEIFNSALSLFAQKGYDGVSIRDIAKAVGIKESSIYNHYSSKRSILDEICRRFLETLMVSRPPLAEVEQMICDMRPTELFLELISSYGSKIDPQITQMAKVVFGEQFYDEAIHEIFEREFIRNNVNYYIEVLSMMEDKKQIQRCDKTVVANLFNNEQMMLSLQFSGCKTDEERLKLGELMRLSAEYLFHPLEVVT